MKTASEMYQYYKTNDFGENIYGWGEKHFKIIEKSLANDEQAEICFMGLFHNAQNEALGYFAFAITNKRLICAQKKALGGDVIKFINYDNINDITVQNNLIGSSTLTFDTYKEIFKVWFGGKQAEKVYDSVEKFLSNQRNNKKSAPSISAADEIRKFKQLLDDGIITEEEFESKKRELLK